MPKTAVHKEVGDGLPPPKSVASGVAETQPLGEVDAISGVNGQCSQEKQSIDDDDIFGDRGQYIETAWLELLTHICSVTNVLCGTAQALHDFRDGDGEDYWSPFGVIIRVFTGKEFIHELAHLDG